MRSASSRDGTIGLQRTTADRAPASSQGAMAVASPPAKREIEPSAWQWDGPERAGDNLVMVSNTEVWVPMGGQTVGRSAAFDLQSGGLDVFEIEVNVAPGNTLIRIEVAPTGSADSSGSTYRDILVEDGVRTALVFAPANSGRYELRLKILGHMLGTIYRGSLPPHLSWTVPRCTHTSYPALPPLAIPTTELPHWNRLERTIHHLCRSSRSINSAVAALEVRMGRQEVLSLPQYLAICPTGQCNATCAFCSVTINRTGIIKRQLNLDTIRAFTAPAGRTVRMYGIEGNGEPMLSRDFPGLVQHVLSDGSIAYLITNASQITAETLPLLLGLDSINISMNAATAATHRRVMGLKNFDEICANIKELIKRRGTTGNRPSVSISLVVTRDNIFEAVAFLELAERLGVNRALLRPLSELGNDAGTVEDLRDLVPYESDVADLVEAVGEYLAATQNSRKVEVVFYADQFKATRPDPPIMTVLPVDRPDEVPLPRQKYWTILHEALRAEWLSVDRCRLVSSTAGVLGPILRSTLVPVPPGRPLAIEIGVRSSNANLKLVLRDSDHRFLAETPLPASGTGERIPVRLPWGPAPVHGVIAEIVHTGGPFDALIDLGRTRTPALPGDMFSAIPQPARWELPSPGATVSWNGAQLTLQWSGAPGPYLAKSYSRPCIPHLDLAYPVTINVRSGTIGIGILTEDFQSWHKTFAFEEGEHIVSLDFNTGSNKRLQVVVYSAGEKPLDATIDWERAMQSRQPTPEELTAAMAAFATSEREAQEKRARESGDDKESRRQAVRAARAELEAAESEAGTEPETLQPAPIGRPPRGGSVTNIFTRREAIYCHKPWTDLANFTVDGRVDVCCIATGASQSRYALGNLSRQSFQDVWNGPRAREFRRTVNNAETALPPCRRCPMAKSYAGPFLSPSATVASVWARYNRGPLRRTKIGRKVILGLFVLTYGPLHALLFRGFDGPRFWQLAKRYKDVHDG